LIKKKVLFQISFYTQNHNKVQYDNMNAIAINKYGGLDVLEKVNVPKPTPQPRDLIVQSK